MFPSCQFWVANVSCLSHFVYLVVHCLFCIGCFMMGINTWKRFSHFMLTPVCSFICLRSYLLASTVESFSLKTPNQVLSPFAIAHESVYILISGHISFYTKYITWSSILGRLCLSTVMVTPKCGCNEPVVFFQLAFTYWADLFISQTLAFMSSLTWLYRIDLSFQSWPVPIQPTHCCQSKLSKIWLTMFLFCSEPLKGSTVWESRSLVVQLKAI